MPKSFCKKLVTKWDLPFMRPMTFLVVDYPFVFETNITFMENHLTVTLLFAVTFLEVKDKQLLQQRSPYTIKYK